MGKSNTDDIPPSARFVLDVLERDGESSRQDLLAATELPEATLDRALDSLRDANKVTKTSKPDDVRQVVYRIED